jgi:hypothetical protein
MSRNLVRPYFPVPPQDYTQGYMSEVLRSFSVFLEQNQNPGEGRHTALVLTRLQGNDQGLEVGALFEHNGYVKITKSNVPHVGSVSGTGGVGTVTVTTS